MFGWAINDAADGDGEGEWDGDQRDECNHWVITGRDYSHQGLWRRVPSHVTSSLGSPNPLSRL